MKQGNERSDNHRRELYTFAMAGRWRGGGTTQNHMGMEDGMERGWRMVLMVSVWSGRNGWFDGIERGGLNRYTVMKASEKETHTSSFVWQQYSVTDSGCVRRGGDHSERH